MPIAPYATPGAKEIPDSIAPSCRFHDAVLLVNNGAVKWGKNLLEAYYRLESLECHVQIMMYTGNIIGRSNELTCHQVSDLVQIRERLGIRSGVPRELTSRRKTP